MTIEEEVKALEGEIIEKVHSILQKTIADKVLYESTDNTIRLHRQLVVAEIEITKTIHKEIKLRLLKNRMSVVDIKKIVYIELCEHWQGMSKHKTTEVIAEAIYKEQSRILGI